MGNFDDETHVPPEQGEEPAAPPPLQAFAHRHRLTIGLVVAVGMGAIMAWSLLAAPPATVPGFYGIIQRYAFPLMCLLIAGVGLTWGFKLRTLWVNLCAYAAIATYLIYLVVGWVYEYFVAG